VSKVLRGGTKFKVEWGSSPGCGEKEGAVSKQEFFRDQLKLVVGEETSLAIEWFKNADSWNSYETEFVKRNVVKMFRERKVDKWLEVLCLCKGNVLPQWIAVTSIETKSYRLFKNREVCFLFFI
jgi:hypothetical protein